VIGSGKLYSVKNPVIMIAGTTKSRSSRIHKLNPNESMPAITYRFAETQLEISDDVYQLSALGILSQKNSDVGTSKFASKLIDSTIRKKLLENTKVFRLFGQNTLPIYDSFFYNINPYIPELSGNEDGCNSLIRYSNIPISKRSFPISKLKSEEVQSLTQYLVTMISPKLVKQIIGPDYILLRENLDNSLRFFSNLMTLINTSLAQQNLGDIFAVLLGDRTRALRNMIDSHMAYCKNALSGLSLLKSRLEDSDKILERKDEVISIVSSIGIHKEVLSDVAIIANAHDILDSDIIIMKSEISMDIVFNHYSNKLNEFMKQLVQREIAYSTPTKQSIRLEALNKKDQKEVQRLTSEFGGD
jgi:hypothetical protein